MKLTFRNFFNISKALKKQEIPSTKEAPKTVPGDGLRSLRSTTAFRVINYELYAKPNIVIMVIGVIAITSAMGYIAYMRAKYESEGFYSAVQSDGTEVFTKRKSKWDK